MLFVEGLNGVKRVAWNIQKINRVPCLLHPHWDPHNRVFCNFFLWLLGGTWINWPFFSIYNPFPSISPGHPQSKITNTSFCALVEYLLTGLACVFENCRRYFGPESYFSKIWCLTNHVEVFSPQTTSTCAGSKHKDLCIYMAEFQFRPWLMKLTAISLELGQTRLFLTPISLKITEKREKRERERQREKKFD